MGCSCPYDRKLIQINDNERKRNETKIKFHTDEITCLTINKKEDLLATGSLDSHAIIWVLKDNDKKEPKILQKIELRRSKTITKYDVESKADGTFGKPLIFLMGHHKPITCVKFSPDDFKLATGSLDHTIVIWNVDMSDIDKYGFPIIRLRNDLIQAVNTIDFSPNELHIASGGSDKNATIWDVYIPIQQKKTRTVIIKDLNDGKKFEFEVDINKEIEKEEDLKELLMNKGRYDQEKKEQELSKNCGRIVGSLVEHTSSLYAVRYDKEGRKLATGSDDNSVILWNSDVESSNFGNIITKLYGHKHFINSICFSWDGMRLATGSSDESAKVWCIDPQDKHFGDKVKSLKKHISYRRKEKLVLPVRIRKVN